MTEEQAKTKWCPMVRYGTQGRNDEGGANKPPPERNGLACIGSDCMMWRWDYHHGNGEGHCGIAGSVALP